MISSIAYQIVLGLKLNSRNRMALIYGYVFPLLFLLAFWVIYRNDQDPLALHMGQLLTVTILGSACFGLPTTFVGERERGVWRRYRLSPTPTWVFVATTLATRYILLISAAALQFAIAFAMGMSMPAHPAGVLAAFTVSAFAFLGLGMVIAMLATTVPAVQALGQCIFLPMLIIGGVAVPLVTLPDWALHVSAFFPGRYAVHAMQICLTGPGLSGGRFDLLALLMIGAVASVTAAKMFRWDVKQRFDARGGKVWIVAALGMWIVVGLLAEHEGRVAANDAPSAETQDVSFPGEPSSWQNVSDADIENVAFERLPPDTGLVSPIAGPDEQPDPGAAAQLAQIGDALGNWAPAKVADPVQRARNILYVAAVPDVLQMAPIERFVPAIVFSKLRGSIPEAELPGILYWIAMHPNDGDDSAVNELQPLGLPAVSGPTREVRGRVMLYSLKLLGRLTNHLP